MVCKIEAGWISQQVRVRIVAGCREYQGCNLYVWTRCFVFLIVRTQIVV
jgi:hypothetical protein